MWLPQAKGLNQILQNLNKIYAWIVIKGLELQAVNILWGIL